MEASRGQPLPFTASQAPVPVTATTPLRNIRRPDFLGPRSASILGGLESEKRADDGEISKAKAPVFPET